MKNQLTIASLILLFSFLFSNCASSKIIKEQNTNKEIVRKWFEEGWNKNMTKELVPICFDKNWEQGNSFLPDQLMGHDGVNQVSERFGSAFSEIHFEITHLFSEGNIVGVRYNLDAIHSGAFYQVAPTNTKITSSGMGIYEMENGKIKVTWGEIDFLGILTQIK